MIEVDGRVRYDGECVDLGRRFNAGYSAISLTNCLAGGQQTNCRINSLVLGAVQAGARVSVYFAESEARNELEARLIGALRQPGTANGPQGRRANAVRPDIAVFHPSRLRVLRRQSICDHYRAILDR